MNVHDYMRRLGDLLAVTETIIKERDEARKERDDARQRLCKVVGDNRDMWGEDVAKEYGWDCFEKENHNA